MAYSKIGSTRSPQPFWRSLNDIALDEVNEDGELILENGSLGSTSVDTYTKCNDKKSYMYFEIKPELLALVLQPRPPAVNKHKYDHQN